jgi:predicted esterase
MLRRMGTIRRVALVAVLLLVTSGCDLLPIPGEGPLRYRDVVINKITTTYDVAYGSAVDQQGQTVTLEADVYQPAEDTATQRPLIIWVHGGGFEFGSKIEPDMVDQATYFSRLGYVNASISYRLRVNGCAVPDAGCIQAINDARADAQAAVRFFRANAATFGIDPDRIAIGGTSAGAITALGVAYGSVDAESSVRGASSLSGAVIFPNLIDPSDPDTLLFHDDTDPVVPYAWAKNTVNIAGQNGLKAYLITWENEFEMHACYWCHRQQILELETNFFYRVLDAGGAA